jgi:drug/metabolite transporter (DMT)-like permease
MPIKFNTPGAILSDATNTRAEHTTLPPDAHAQHHAPRRWKVALALALVYVVWGTTYLAIQVALADMPALTMNGLRFCLAGGVMLMLARWQGSAWPTRREALCAALAGLLMAFGAMSLVVLAQQQGVGSGLMATVVTTMPMWLALWSAAGGERVPRSSWFGLVLGVGGAALLSLEKDFSASPLGMACAFGAPLCWSVGSWVTRRWPQPDSLMAPAIQWLAGGVAGTALALMLEPVSRMLHASSGAWLAWVYLVMGGTLVALNAYLWLLKHTPAALAGSYAFVNPAVALLMGLTLGGEHVSGWVFVALPLMLVALTCIVYGPQLQQVFASRWNQATNPQGIRRV